MHISRVTEASEELMGALNNLIPQLTHKPPPSFSDVTALLNTSSVLLIARYPDDAGPIVGSGTLAVFRTPTGIHAHIEDVVVDSRYRRLDIGEELVKQLLKLANEIGLDGVSLTCNPERVQANKLYLKLGFNKWETNLYWYDFN
jgi:ribosomal protein S18 acetylase RimI-like enzyme